MAPNPLPIRPSKFQIDNQWLEFYEPALKYGAKISTNSIIGDSSINIEDSGLPFGSFGTLDFVGFTLLDNGNGTVSIQSTSPGTGIILQENGTPLSALPFVTLNFIGATLTDQGSGLSDITITPDGSTIDWSTVNWANFFADIDWTLNSWTDFFTSFYSEINWTDFIDEIVANWTSTNWNTFIDEFIDNVDEDDVFNFLDQVDADKGDILVNDGTNWNLLPVGTDGQVLAADSSETNGVKWEDASTGFNNNIIYGTFKSHASVILDWDNTDETAQVLAAGDTYNKLTNISSAMFSEFSTAGEGRLTFRNGQFRTGNILCENIPPTSATNVSIVGYAVDGIYSYMVGNFDSVDKIYRIDVTNYTVNSGVEITKSGGTITLANINGITVRDNVAILWDESAALAEKYTISGTTMTFDSTVSFGGLTVTSLDKVALGKDGWFGIIYNGVNANLAIIDDTNTVVKEVLASSDPMYIFSIDDVFFYITDNGTTDPARVIYIQ